MATTYEAIATVTVGSGGAGPIEFTNIPQTYTDLRLLVSGRSTRNNLPGDDFYVGFNSSTSGYTSRWLRGDGSGITSSSSTSLIGIYCVTNGDTATASTFGNADIYIPNYTSSNNKSVMTDSVSENNATQAFMFLVAGLWSNTAAITSIKLTPDTPTWKQYTTATLYGIKNS